jgi:outer membrane protein, heavy metal efflux system
MSLRLLRAAAMAGALLPAACALAAPLTLDQAMGLAVKRSSMARAARAGAQSAAETARAAGQQPDPLLTVGIDNLPVAGADRFSTTADGMTMKRIGIAQEWVSVNKRAAREAVATAMASRESTQAQVAAADTRLQTALAYLDAYYAGEALKLMQLSEHHAHEELEAGRGRLATPSGSSAEVLALAGSLGMAEDESEETRQQRTVAETALQRWVGEAVAELIAPPKLAAPTSAQFVSLHPAVIVKQRDLDVARQELAAARSNRRPNWTWEVSYGQRTGYPDMVSFGVSIPLTVAPAARQDRETAAKQALVDKAEAELDEAQRAAAGEYAALASDAERLQMRTARYRNAVLVPAQQRSATTLAAYGSNQASLSMLFEARHAEVQAQRKLLTLERDLAKTLAQLSFKPIGEGVEP